MHTRSYRRRRSPSLPSLLLLPLLFASCRNDRAPMPSPDLAPPPPPLPPAHSRDEIDRRQAQLAAEAERLPPSLRTLVTPRLRIIATVSVTEGGFSGIATHHGDRAASLGIFQWAMARHKSVDEGASLWRFFSDLQRRARHCDKRSDECALYRRAWRQCRKAGLKSAHGNLYLRGRPATGGDVERALQPAMATGALRSYQLVAACDWIARIAAQKVALPSAPSTVGALLRSDRALATAVLIGVNRPAYLVPALQRAVAAVVASGTASDEEALLRELRRETLELYKPGERDRRAMRLNTSDEAFSPP